MRAPLRFWKMTGAGNDFVVLDGRDGLPKSSVELARVLCARRTSVGADGLIAIRRAGPQRVEVEFVNADGSPAGFCGNGARCTAKYAFLRGLAGAPLELVFPALTVTAEPDGEEIEITGPRPSTEEPEIVIEFKGRALRGRRIRAGVDHVLLEEPRDRPHPLADLAEKLFVTRPDLRGNVNVTLVRPDRPGVWFVRTFERGVGETLACGSGALAAAAFVEPVPGAGISVVLVPPALIPLRVRLEPGNGPAKLTGEARLVYRGEIDL